MNKKYKIGEFAQNLGVSSGFLKHHEKHGLLHPNVSESGYRYYEFSQGRLAVECLRLQNLGFTSKEISDLLNDSAGADMPSMVQAKELEIEKRIAFYEEVLRYLRENEEPAASSADRYAEKTDWTIMTPEPFYYAENVAEREFIEDEQLYAVAHDWNQYAPMMTVCSRLSLAPDTELPFTVAQWHMGLQIAQSSADRLHALRNDRVQLVTPGRCLVYNYAGYRSSTHGRNFLADVLANPLAICQKHHFAIQGDIYIFNLFGSNASDRNYTRERICLPIDA